MGLRTVCRLLLILLVPGCLAQPAVPEGLTAYWPFEDAAAATAVDVTGHGHDLALAGVRREPGAIGQGLCFAGEESAVQAPLAEDLQTPAAMTLECWVRPDAIPPGSEGIGTLNLGNVLLRLTRGIPSFHVFTDQWGPILAEGTVRPGQWYHLAGSYDGREMRVYVNGELAGVRERTGAVARCDRPLQLGRQADPLVGVMDEAKVYTRCLTGDEVAAAFAAGVSRLNPGVRPGTLRYPGETWSDVGWSTHRLPAALVPLADARLVGTQAAGTDDTLCAVTVAIPRRLATGSTPRPGLAEQSWRFAAALGCSGAQVWPPPGPSEDWEALAQMLTCARAEALSIAVPLPMHPKAMQAAWERLAAHAPAIGVVVVGNGIPTNPSLPLRSWRPTGALDEWVEACALARRLVPPNTGVFGARLPLAGEGALERIAAAAARLDGKVQGLCITVLDATAPEAVVEGPLRQAVACIRGHGLDLWVDAAVDPAVGEPERTACILRLVLLCQSQGIRLTLWPGPGPEKAPPGPSADPTGLFSAIQAWHRAANPPVAPVELPMGVVRVLRWRDSSGRSYVAWWHTDTDTGTVGSLALELPLGAVVIDPLHARELHIQPGAPVPLCRWPLVARCEGP